MNSSAKFRGTNDFYPTPAGATWALVHLGVLRRRVWAKKRRTGKARNA